MALRFMDANDYQPLGIRVITPKDGYTTPELLDEAKRGSIPTDLKVNQQRVYNLLDGKIPSTNPQNEAFKELLIAACNHLHTTFPFLFEKIDDYTELLLPDDLTSDFSIVTDMRNGMPVDDCKNVEIIGWIYQFYISEKKDEVFASKAKVKKEDIPAATQLFTPRWIVEYMVQNTVGKLWLQNRPNSKLREYMPYFIESESLKADDYLRIGSPEEILLADPASGSGHILVYAFDLFTKIYEEEGYNTTDIPKLIIDKNLYGFEIDERAAQLSGLALMMKAREYHRRAFRRDITPNILCYEDLKLNVYSVDGFEGTFKVKKDSELLEQVLSYGYNIAEDIFETKIEEHTDKDTGETIEVDIKKKIIPKGGKTVGDFIIPISLYGNSEIIFYQDDIKDVFRQLSLPLSYFLYTDLLLTKQATNYGSLIIPRASIKEIETSIEQLTQKGRNTDIFLKSKIDALHIALNQLLILAQKFHCVVANPPYMGDGNMNQILSGFIKNEYSDSKSDVMACFMEAGLNFCFPLGFLGMINQQTWMFISSYSRLRNKLLLGNSIDTLVHIGFNTFPALNSKLALGASFSIIKNSNQKNGVYFNLNNVSWSANKKKVFEKRLEEKDFYIKDKSEFFKITGTPIAYWLNKNWLNIFNQDSIGLKAISDGQNITGDNTRYLRFHWEVNINNINPHDKWSSMAKGGEIRKWYGNVIDVIDWSEESRKRYKKNSAGRIQSEHLWYRKGITWTLVAGAGFRVLDDNSLFNKAAPSILFNDSDLKYLNTLLGFLNCKIAINLLEVLNPTLNTNIKEILLLPFKYEVIDSVENLVETNVLVSKKEWDKKEISINYKLKDLLLYDGQDLEESYDLYKQYWKNKFIQLHQNEEELNRQFIEIYGLQDELTPDVPLEDITILQDELDRKALAKLNKKLVRNPQTLAVTNYHDIELPFIASEVLEQFISYAVGCMFGRYSLDKEGLILANQGETLEDYYRLVDGGRCVVDGSETVDGGRCVVDGSETVDGGRWMVDGSKMVDGEEVVDGSETVDGERWMVDGNSSDIKKYEYGEGSEFYAAEGVATGNGANKGNVPADEANAQGGVVWANQPDKEGSSEHTIEHSRRASTGNKGVYPLSDNSKRLIGRVADSTHSYPPVGNDSGSEDTTSTNQHNQSCQATQQPNQNPASKNLTTHRPPTFLPDNDNIIPILDSEWFEDDIVGRFYTFLKVTFGEKNFNKNLAFIEEQIGMDMRRYFTKNFYPDHVQRYKKRPIYWMFSSPKGSFNALIYMHRYTPDTVSNILNKYLKEFIGKLKSRKEHLQHIQVSGSPAEKTKAIKESDAIDKMLMELHEYERDTLYPLATQRIAIDLDDGVLVNYNKFGKAIKEIAGLNDKKTKDKVREFDWIDVSEIR
jgi:type II restriction/modification system DNA methylase subunit YeeA